MKTNLTDSPFVTPRPSPTLAELLERLGLERGDDGVRAALLELERLRELAKAVATFDQAHEYAELIKPKPGHCSMLLASTLERWRELAGVPR